MQAEDRSKKVESRYLPLCNIVGIECEGHCATSPKIIIYYLWKSYVVISGGRAANYTPGPGPVIKVFKPL